MVILITLIIDQVLQLGVVIVPVSILVVVAIHDLAIFTLDCADSLLLLCPPFGKPPHVHVFLHVCYVLLAQIFIDLVQFDIRMLRGAIIGVTLLPAQISDRQKRVA